MSNRNLLGIILTLASLAMWVPGISFDAFSIRAEISLPFLGNQEVFKETRSVLGAIQAFWKKGNYLPFFLISFFGLLVPLVKAIVLALAVVLPNQQHREKWVNFVQMISKWAMADVFAVAMVLALLVVNSNDKLDGQIHSGFYWFSAYVVVSTLASQLIDLGKSKLDSNG